MDRECGSRELTSLGNNVNLILRDSARYKRSFLEADLKARMSSKLIQNS